MKKKKKLTKAQKIAKGNRIDRLMQNNDLQEAVENVEEALINQFREIAPSDRDGIHLIKERLHMLNSVKANLYQAIQDGKLEDFQTSQENTPYLGDLSTWQPKRITRQ